MSESGAPAAGGHFRRNLGVVCGLYFLAATFHASWGLPNGDQTWAADSVAPMTPLAVAYRTFAEKGFDSGYFYFKYPTGHQLLLAAVTAPVVGIAYLRGDLHGVQNDYPFGFAAPESYLAAMALLARVLSAAFATGIVALLADLTRRLSTPTAGLYAALMAAGCYPLLFYAHTSNVETACLFWAVLALWSAARAVEEERPRMFLLTGVAAALAISTKEQIVGFFALLPLVIVVRQLTRARDERGLARLLPRGAAAGAVAALVAWLAANAAFFNPSGFINRLRFLTHTLPADVRAEYAAYEFPIDFSTDWTLADEIAHVLKALAAVVSSVGWPTAIAATAGLVLLARRQPRLLLYVACAFVGYYAVSLRLLKQVELRYVLPWSALVAVPAGVFLSSIAARGRGGRIVALLVCVFAVVYSGDVLRLLAGDARYQAESWMAPHLAQGESVEVYQSWTYLPRWARAHGVVRPPVDAMAVADVRERSPDFIVLSSKGKEGITMYPNPDWRDGRGMMLEREENKQMLAALESGALGYEPVARFERRPLIPRELITSLAPAISVYRRVDAAGSRPLVTSGGD